MSRILSQTPATDELRQKIRYLKDVVRLSMRQIARETGVTRGRCSRLYLGMPCQGTIRQKALDKYQSLIATWYKEHSDLKAVQVHQRLCERGVKVSRATVSRQTRRYRIKKQQSYFPLTFLPGEEAQVDWFFFNHPQLGHLAGFVFVLSYSRYSFGHFFPRSSFEFFIQGHLLAFSAIKGTPKALRYDNLKSVVIKRDPLTYNSSFLDFARHYGFEIRLCNVACGNEKGRVERTIRTIRDTFCNTANGCQSLEALNAAFAQWLDNKNQSIHRATEKIPSQILADERLKPLGPNAFRNSLVYPAKLPTKTGLLIFDTNHYSIPEYLVGIALSVHAFCDRIEVFDPQGHKVATHPRSFARNQTIINPAHRSYIRISAKAKQERIFSLVNNLDPAISRFLELNQQLGEDSHWAAYYIFTLLKTYARAMIVSAVREVLAQQMPRLKALQVLLNSAQNETINEVQPINAQLLSIDYQPRALDEYDKRLNH